MLIGPFNSFHVSEITALLSEHKVGYELIQDPQVLEKIRAEESQRGPRNHPTFASTGDYIYFEIDDYGVKQILPQLEKFGIVEGNTSDEASLLESAEYHCLYCDKTSDQPGVCDVHNARLLEFSEWIDASAKSGKFGQKGQFYFFIFAMIVFASVILLRTFGVF